MQRRVLIQLYDGVGGPKNRIIDDDGFWAGPTRAGAYRVAFCGRHRSRRYPDWSRIPWGTPLRDSGTEVTALIDGAWKDVAKLTTVTRDDILDYHESLYGVRRVPSAWVFNDFGHMTCYIFRDLNQNGRLDPAAGEHVAWDFFHTTPPDEARTQLGLAVRLEPSHGCIHVKPRDIDAMIQLGYMRRGVRVVVHGYDEKIIRFPKAARARPPFELHFFPGLRKIAVVGTWSP